MRKLDQKDYSKLLDKAKNTPEYQRVFDAYARKKTRSDTKLEMKKIKLKCDSNFKKSLKLISDKFKVKRTKICMSYFHDEPLIRTIHNSDSYEKIAKSLLSYNTNFTQVRSLVENWMNNSETSFSKTNNSYKSYKKIDNEIETITTKINKTNNLLFNECNLYIKNMKTTKAIRNQFSNSKPPYETSFNLSINMEIWRALEDFSKAIGINVRFILIHSLTRLFVVDSKNILNFTTNFKSKDSKANFIKITESIITDSKNFNNTIHDLNIVNQDNEFDSYSVSETLSKLEKINELYKLINECIRNIIDNETTKAGQA